MARRCSRALADPTAGFSPSRKNPRTLPSSMSDGRLVGRVVARDAGQVVEAPVVVGRGRLAPPGLEQADEVGVHVAPEAALLGVLLEVGGQVRVALGVGHGDVAGQQVVQGRDVGGALDGGVAAQGHDPAAGPADVAQQQLEDGRGADVLGPDRVLGPADRVGEAGRPLPARVLAQQLGHLQELVGGDAADLLDQLRGVAAEVPAQELEHAARVLEGLVGCSGGSAAPAGGAEAAELLAGLALVLALGVLGVADAGVLPAGCRRRCRARGRSR